MKTSALAAGVRACVLLGAALIALPGHTASPEAARPHATGKLAKPRPAAAAPKAKATDAAAKAKPTGVAKGAAKPAGVAKSAAPPAQPEQGTLADFGKAPASADVMHVANWVSFTGNNQKKAFVLIDKKQARLYVFDPRGKLKSHSPVLLGKAVGDTAAPGIGNKPISQITENEKTTPAGRFLALPGKNNHGEDIIWIDYNAAVSMHRLRKVAAEQQRAQRMATADVSDNRISYGCVNVPANFYNAVLRPTVTRYGAFVYVLPETRTPQQQFGSYDVTARKVAAR
ncbi:MAG: hypothetical protein JWP22_3433 [Ramlibacter sp.]|nr:hypothetical protein [Ramlibacter sp.]